MPFQSAVSRIVASLLLLAPLSAAVADAKEATAAPRMTILKLIAQIDRAFRTHDASLAAPLIADDFQYWSFKGKRLGKRDLLRTIARNDESTSRTYDEDVRVFENTAIYTALVMDTWTEGGKVRSETTTVTDVWERRAVGWQLVADHESIVKP